MSTAQTSWECSGNWCGSGVVVSTAKLAGEVFVALVMRVKFVMAACPNYAPVVMDEAVAQETR